MQPLEKLAVKVKRNVRYAAGRAAYYTGFNNPDAARGGRILIYHGVCLEDANRFHPIYIKLRDLETQLRLFKKHFNVLSLADYMAGRWSSDRFNLAISFDDGFANNHQYALPLLERLKLPATFFVTGIRATAQEMLWNDFLALLGKFGPPAFSYRDVIYHGAPFLKYRSGKSGLTLTEELRNSDFEEKAGMMKDLGRLIPARAKELSKPWWQQMTADQIRQCADSPQISIGAHGMYHNDLALIEPAAAATELLKSREFLESVTGKPVESLAFPYGAYTRPLLDQARLAGYRQLCAMDFLFPEDRQDTDLCERLTVNPFISPVDQLLACVSGRYENHPA